jgi:O6-methylguanine-DNA--protein-cysteine methyltransferase
MINAPFGAVGIYIKNDCVTRVTLYPAKQTERNVDGSCAQNVKQQIAQYFQNADTKIDVPFEIAGTQFQQHVWKIQDGLKIKEWLLAHESK